MRRPRIIRSSVPLWTACAQRMKALHSDCNNDFAIQLIARLIKSWQISIIRVLGHLSRFRIARRCTSFKNVQKMNPGLLNHLKAVEIAFSFPGELECAAPQDTQSTNRSKAIPLLKVNPDKSGLRAILFFNLCFH